MAFYIDEVTELHAQQTSAEGLIYENESDIPLPSGGSIRFEAFPDEVSYVRVCDDDGRELMCWVEDEFKDDFGGTMGAFLGLARAVAVQPRKKV